MQTNSHLVKERAEEQRIAKQLNELHNGREQKRCLLGPDTALLEEPASMSIRFFYVYEMRGCCGTRTPTVTVVSAVHLLLWRLDPSVWC